MLSLEDRAAWGLIAETITPLGPDAGKDQIHFSPKTEKGLQKKDQNKLCAAVPTRSASPLKDQSAYELDAKTHKRLKRGQVTIEARLDLHGYTQTRAHQKLLQFLGQCHQAGYRCVLVITGKGIRGTERNSGSAFQEERGILNRMLPEWISSSSFCSAVLKCQPAAPKDGGSGAFYIYFRRPRK